MTKKKICVYIGGRANYSSAKSVLTHVSQHPDLELQLLVGAAAVVDRYGRLDHAIEEDGFDISYRFHNIVEGETPLTMTKTAGLGLLEASTAIDFLKPDVVLVVGDRYDVLPVAVAAVFMNVRVAHTMGGEVTGTVDESIRHALTKLAHIHFPANEDSRERIIKMGEPAGAVFNVGCPRNDLVLEQTKGRSSVASLGTIYDKQGGVGGKPKLGDGFLLVSQHPVTTEYGANRDHMEATLNAAANIAMPTLLLWPNSDAGSNEVSRAVRIYREKNEAGWLHAFKDLPVDIYIDLMNTTSCLVGNSSSGIREGAMLGTPVVNIGNRQSARLCGNNVMTVANDAQAIEQAIRAQLSHGRYNMDALYGNGTAGAQIADILASFSPPLQKRIVY